MDRYITMEQARYMIHHAYTVHDQITDGLLLLNTLVMLVTGLAFALHLRAHRRWMVEEDPEHMHTGGMH